MLNLSKAQVTNLQAKQMFQFKDKLNSHLQLCFPEEFAHMDADDQADFIDRTVNKGLKIGIRKERNLCTYASIQLVLETEIECQPHQKQIDALLNEVKFNETARVEQSYERLLTLLDD